MLEYTTTSSANKESSSYTLIILKRSEKETKSDPLFRALNDLCKKEDEKDEVGKRYHRLQPQWTVYGCTASRTP